MKTILLSAAIALLMFGGRREAWDSALY